MKSSLPCLLAVLGGILLWMGGNALAAAPYEDIPIGSLPADSVKMVMYKTLSPQGRFAILAPKGVVRVFDTPDKIAAARQQIEALQNGPSVVTFSLAIRTGMHRVTRYASDGPFVSDYEIPVPQTYGPPQIVQRGGGVTVIPGTPENFTTQYVDPGSRPYIRGYINQGGYVSGEEVGMSETGIEGGTIRQFAGSMEFPNPAVVTAQEKVEDIQSLRDWAEKSGVVPAGGPVWTSARTEFLVTPEHADNGILLNILPRIVAVTGDGASRVYPVKFCAASLLVKQGVPAKIDGFPGGDAEFYRVFMGAGESTGDALASVTATAVVRYVQPADR